MTELIGDRIWFYSTAPSAPATKAPAPSTAAVRFFAGAKRPIGTETDILTWQGMKFSLIDNEDIAKV